MQGYVKVQDALKWNVNGNHQYATMLEKSSSWWLNEMQNTTFSSGERDKYVDRLSELQTLWVVFCDGEKYSKDTSFLPLIAKEVHEFNKRYIINN